ncbi:MAG TPA: universal stress protein [Dehalococcoidia bacterium]|nr:hypothetical protein [Dehalococcoidia bacterium]HIM18819.1 universal stress protein [Dehalococcoidia bacterium]
MYVDTIVDQLRSQGIRAEAVVVFGEPAERIVEAARDEQCDLIAMSAYDRNVVRWAFLGSVADRGHARPRRQL